jgi:hypothetical protein
MKTRVQSGSTLVFLFVGSLLTLSLGFSTAYAGQGGSGGGPSTAYVNCESNAINMVKELDEAFAQDANMFGQCTAACVHWRNIYTKWDCGNNLSQGTQNEVNRVNSTYCPSTKQCGESEEENQGHQHPNSDQGRPSGGEY